MNNFYILLVLGMILAAHKGGAPLLWTGGVVSQIVEASSNMWWHPSQVQLGSWIGRYLDKRVVIQIMEASSNMWWHLSQVQLGSWIGKYLDKRGC
jgi:hypothetical protein